MTATAATLKERTREWHKDNPLRRWRARHNLSMMDVAAAAAVAMSSVQHWEQGAYTPNEESIAKLASLMDVQPDTLARYWRDWYNERPTIH